MGSEMCIRDRYHTVELRQESSFSIGYRFCHIPTACLPAVQSGKKTNYGKFSNLRVKDEKEPNIVQVTKCKQANLKLHVVILRDSFYLDLLKCLNMAFRLLIQLKMCSG